jgi:drug/metabolite transporter (DMT)-like permease
MWLQYASILLVISSVVSYHLCQKSLSQAVSPLATLIITYLVAFLATGTLYFFTAGKESVGDHMKQISPKAILLGLAIVGMEVGFFLAYRSGWKIGSASLISNITATAILLPIGMLFFNEGGIGLREGIGMALAVSGVLLVNTH